MKTRVLITGMGGPAGIAVARSLEAAGATVIAADMDPLAAGLYLVPEDRRVLLPAGDDPAFPDAVRHACVAHAADVLVPTVDQELLPVAGIARALHELGVDVMLAGEAALARCLDKWKLYQSLLGVIPVPRTRLLLDEVELDRWPLIAKPRRGSGSRGVCTVRRPADLDRLPRDGSYLLQELLPGEEYSVDVLVSLDGEPLAAVPRERMKIDSGVAVTARVVRDQELERLARWSATTLGLTHAANIQFRRDAAGCPKLLEINPRFPGTMPLTIAAGIDMPKLCLDLIRGRAVRVDEPREVAMVRFLESVAVPALELDAMCGRAAEGHEELPTAA
jgi:carbamoyl-phosphate synthase large subunit